jgi:molecular chaperone GrpE
VSKKQQNPSDDSVPDENINDVTSELNEYEQQIQQLTEALMRERADSENIRRRHEEQLNNVKSHIKSDVIKDLLPVIDNFERALKHVPKELENNDYVKGVQGVVKQFELTLQNIGVQKIKTIGEPFNPELHEAVSMEDGDGDQEIISEELQSGYILGESVIRHAMVRVKRQ